jgi:hypothetical protein
VLQGLLSLIGAQQLQPELRNLVIAKPNSSDISTDVAANVAWDDSDTTGRALHRNQHVTRLHATSAVCRLDFRRGSVKPINRDLQKVPDRDYRNTSIDVSAHLDDSIANWSVWSDEIFQARTRPAGWC